MKKMFKIILNSSENIFENSLQQKLDAMLDKNFLSKYF